MHPYDRCYVPGRMSCHLGGTHHPGYSGEVNSLRILGIPTVRDLTLASRGVRITVTDLTPFLPIRYYGELAAKVIYTFHPAAETLWDSTRYLKS
ncbi:hypothetical protein PIB30_069383 [Stylosanthes scabra]|uniref:Uncharacterized protein n=1 Tax=Stylosanthes scabra TaxID=79078 RepID=A0ABU6XMV8_9FABA|nr:hypothetical protein [Stylosanthes scabra]